MAGGGQSGKGGSYGVNPNQNAANGMQQAFNMTSGAAQNYNNFANQGGGTYNPAMMGAAQTTAQGYDPSMQGGPDAIHNQMGNYQNPYQQQVIDRTAADMNRNLDMQQNQTGAAASAAGAFGGARHGLVEAENMAQTNRAIGDMAANYNSQGFNTAAGLAGQDIGNQMTVAGQNQNAMNQAGQFGANAQNNVNQYNAANRQQQYGANQNAQNTSRQYNAGATNANMNNMFNNNISAAGQLGNLASNSFSMGNQISQNQMNSGTMAQQLQQQIMGQGQGMYDQWSQQPQNALQMRLQSLGMNPLNNATTTTQTSNPGWGSMFGNLLGAAGNAVNFSPIKLGGG